MALFLPDANVLIRALRKDSRAHEACRRWLLQTTENGDDLGLAELVEAALLRIPTIRKLQLLPVSEVLGFWGQDLWSDPHSLRLSAGARHRAIFSELIVDLNLCGDDVNDAWLAALAMEHGAILVSTDEGFARFPNLNWANPLQRES